MASCKGKNQDVQKTKNRQLRPRHQRTAARRFGRGKEASLSHAPSSCMALRATTLRRFVRPWRRRRRTFRWERWKATGPVSAEAARGKEVIRQHRRDASGSSKKKKQREAAGKLQRGGGSRRGRGASHRVASELADALLASRVPEGHARASHKHVLTVWLQARHSQSDCHQSAAKQQRYRTSKGDPASSPETRVQVRVSVRVVGETDRATRQWRGGPAAQPGISPGPSRSRRQ